jgi:hypothetical protein
MPEPRKYEGKLNSVVSSREGATERVSFQAAVLLEEFWEGFISRSQEFLRNVHNLFTFVPVAAPPAGLRLETAAKIDKKKMNFIF